MSGSCRGEPVPWVLVLRIAINAGCWMSAGEMLDGVPLDAYDFGPFEDPRVIAVAPSLRGMVATLSRLVSWRLLRRRRLGRRYVYCATLAGRKRWIGMQPSGLARLPASSFLVPDL